MEIFKNKLFLLLLLAFTGAVISYRLKEPPQVSQQKVLSWIAAAHSQQFCGVIYPRIQRCVTLQPAECLSFATEQITNCVNVNKSNIPEHINRLEAKAVYETNTGCFQTKTHTELLQNYLVKTAECRQILS